MNSLIRLFLHNPARAWVHRNIVTRAGRRGSFLAFLALLDFLYGWSLYTAPAVQQRSVDLILPWPAWGITWTVAGMILITGIPARRDILQFTTAILVKTAWGMTYLNLWLAHGVPRAWVAAVIWLAFAGVIIIVAGWPEDISPQMVLPHISGLPGTQEKRP